MGSGGFGTNESMHWTISHSDASEDTPISGRDPIPVSWIGKGSNGTSPGDKDHEGFLRVRLRFTGADGRESLGELLEYLKEHPPTDDYRLTIDVPMIRRTRAEMAREKKDNWEVRIDW
jgi:hypothetical protein